MMLSRSPLLLAILLLSSLTSVFCLAPLCDRRQALKHVAASSAAFIVAAPAAVTAAERGPPDSLQVEDFLKTGMVSQPMGVSGQAGKSRPETGVVLRDGSDVSRDPRTGSVLAEIVLRSADDPSDKIAVLASYASPWPLAKGTVFDVECRDASTGDGAFLQVSTPVGKKSLEELPDSFFLNQLLASTGRFSFYGPPTDLKVKSSERKGDYRIMDLSFSTVSQATQTEIPRRARMAVTLPNGSSQAVMLVASASALRWKKGSDQAIASTIDSFRAIPGPQGSLKLRGKERRGDSS